MSNSYTYKYIKIYAAEMISILLGIVSLFVVVPYISGNKEIYGVYSLCISTMVFLSYADLGFLGASIKFAAEYYQKGDRKKEIEVLSFGGFILFVIAIIISIGYFVLSFNPGLLVNGIDNSPNLDTAKSLFLWMAVLSPFIGFQRLSQSIFGIRVENYIYQLVNIVGSILRISSVFVFFSGDRYEIVPYFVFIQVVPIICSVITLIIAKFRYKYNLAFLLKSFRWNSKCFDITKDLAMSSFLMTISWVLYYEIDQIVIAKVFGPEQVAIYAMAFALLNYIRMFLSGLFEPFTPRFAHFRASNDIDGLKEFYSFVVNITFPIVVCPIVALCILAKNFIIAWSGPMYIDAIPLSMFFILLNVMASFTYTGGSLMTVFEKTKTLRLLAIILPIVYWSGIALLPHSLSILSFGIMKAIVFMIMVLSYGYLSYKILKLNYHKILQSLFFYNIIPIVVVVFASIAANHFFEAKEKGLSSFVMVCSLIVALTILGYIASVVVNPYVKNYVSRILKGFAGKIKR